MFKKAIFILLFLSYRGLAQAGNEPGTDQPTGKGQHSYLSDKKFDKLTAALRQTLESNAASPAALRDAVFKTLEIVDQNGSPQQKAQLKELVSTPEIKEALNQHVESALISLFKNIDFQKWLGVSVQSVVQGAIPALVIHILIAAASGQTTLEAATTAALHSAIAGGVGGLVNQMQKTAFPQAQGAASKGVTSYVSNVVNAVVQEVALNKPAGSKYVTSLTGGFVALILDVADQAIKKEGGWAHFLLKNVQLTGALTKASQSGEDTTLQLQHGVAFNYLVDSVYSVLSNKELKNYLAAITISTAQGATVAGLLYYLGLGYGPTSYGTALPSIVFRGALEGLFNYAAYNSVDLGLLSQSGTGIVSRSLEKALTTGSKFGLTDLTPTLLQSLTTSAVNHVAVKSGGWTNLLKNLIINAKQATWFEWKPTVTPAELSDLKTE